MKTIGLIGGFRADVSQLAQWPSGLNFLAGLAEVGQFKSVIDRRYPFEQFVEAYRYIDTGRKRGNVSLILK
ncbi:zinc-binding dehydrogenase [Nitrincola tibetensis]|uniref:zinc-binding dehydrogenase n=1 Tax=Nitrincola tibetensis TaxID=2219697 RepID=UPI0019609993|nr:zinc-binding dehydrogenase [Nitrincola tibetensis]